MAIFHCQAKAVSRAAGRSCVAVAAYRAGTCLKDERTGEVHDYTRKQGVTHTELVFPAGVDFTREALWNAAESCEKRKDSKVAREWEIALPKELTARQRQDLARDFAHALVERYGVAVDVCLHAPSREGDQRNHHGHLLTTTRRMTPAGPGEKTRVLDSPRTSGAEVEAMRQTWATLANHALARAGHEARIDPRSLKAQGIEREPTIHLGPGATAMERRGHRTDRGTLNRVQGERDELAALEQAQALANLERERQQAEQAAVAGLAEIRAQYEAREAFEEQKAEKARQEVAEREEQAKAEVRQKSRGPRMR